MCLRCDRYRTLVCCLYFQFFQRFLRGSKTVVRNCTEPPSSSWGVKKDVYSVERTRGTAGTVVAPAIFQRLISYCSYTGSTHDIWGSLRTVVPILPFVTSCLSVFDTVDTLPHPQYLGVLFWKFSHPVCNRNIPALWYWFYYDYVVSVQFNAITDG